MALVEECTREKYKKRQGDQWKDSCQEPKDGYEAVSDIIVYHVIYKKINSACAHFYIEVVKELIKNILGAGMNGEEYGRNLNNGYPNIEIVSSSAQQHSGG